MSSITSVVIIEDDPAVRESMVKIVERGEHLQCVGNFTSAEEALATIHDQAPNIALVDISLPGMNGVDFVRQAAEQWPHTDFIMLTVHDDSNAIFDSLEAGASGYLVKPVRTAQLLAALADVQTGGAPMTSHIARKVVQAFRRPDHANRTSPVGLSERENEVLEYLVAGFLYKEIAAKLGISYNTVSTFINRIYRKLHVRSRAQAVAKFYQQES